MMNTTHSLTAAVLLSLLLSACGGGGGGSSSSAGYEVIRYSGAEGAAEISEENQGALAAGAGEVVALAIDAEGSEDALSDVPIGIQIQDGNTQAEWARQAVERVLSSGLADLPVAASTSIEGDCGGSASITGSGTEANSSSVINYNNYCISLGGDEGNIRFNGKVTVAIATVGERMTTTIRYENFRMTAAGESFSLSGVITTVTDDFVLTESSWNYTMTVDGVTSSWAGSVECDAEYNCEYRSQYEGSDGTVYQVADLEVSEGIDGEYSIEATFYHPDYGYVSLTATDIVLCADGSIGGGVIVLTDDDNTLTITFNGCGSEPVIELDGVAIIIEG